jgi:HAD superfamily hydrolase (TIGR01509 family)
MTGTSPLAIRTILFDLGGVLVDWDGITPLVRLSTFGLDRETVRRFYFESPWVRKLETGKCDFDEFARGVIAELDLPLSVEELRAEFASWVRGPYPGALELLDALAPRYTIACLSNNNPVHWQRARDEFGFGHRFHRAYLSHEIGLVKPDTAPFEHVLRDLGRRADEVLFLDDNPECVATASALGFHARIVRGLDQTRIALDEYGLGPL